MSHLPTLTPSAEGKIVIEGLLLQTDVRAMWVA